MNATLKLHGGMFGLGVVRPRLFESNILLFSPQAANPTVRVGVYGNAPDGRRLWGNAPNGTLRAASSLEEAQEAMGMDWADWHGTKEAIPPAYTRFIGEQLMQVLHRDTDPDARLRAEDLLANRGNDDLRVRYSAILLAVLMLGCGQNVETATGTTARVRIANKLPAVVSTHPSTDLKRTWNLALWDQTRWWGAVEVETASQASLEQAKRQRISRTSGVAPVSTTSSVNGYPCGGSLPSCCTLQKESGGTPTAQNPVSSSSGLWQFTDDTWGGYGGYQHAKDAPPSVQNERAAQVFAGGAGASNWYGDGCYAEG